MRPDTLPSSRRHATSEESARCVDQATALRAGCRRRRIGALAEDRPRRDFSRAGSRRSTHDHERIRLCEEQRRRRHIAGVKPRRSQSPFNVPASRRADHDQASRGKSRGECRWRQHGDAARAGPPYALSCSNQSRPYMPLSRRTIRGTTKFQRGGGGDERGRLALAARGLTRVRNGGLNRLGALGDRPV